MSRFIYRVSLSSEVTAEEMLETLETAGYEVVEVTSKVSTGPTKGTAILEAIQREAQKPIEESVMTRQQIAEEANATVGRVAEIVKEFGDSQFVKDYVERVRTERGLIRAQKSAALALAKAEAKLAAQNAAGANEPPSDDEVTISEAEVNLLSV